MSEAEKKSVDQYGRRTWNVEAYESEAKGTKKHRNNDGTITTIKSDLKDEKSSSDYLKHRNDLISDSLNAVKVHNLINPESSSSTTMAGKNKRFGFYCPICNLSFRDNLALIDHFNSQQHSGKASELSRLKRKEGDKENQEAEDETQELEGGIRRATVQEVMATIEALVQKKLRANQEHETNLLTFAQRVERRAEFERQKRQKRLEKKRKVKVDTKNHFENEESSEMTKIMGITNFGSSKK
ncbi:U4/U6.U5 snRNP associated protein [Scheffersomyces amazonensis]|uniref:U4/U6.U5 snRNP associated protein n=1 Tax=Scheffersomyces amazonensis TaxID=1078765 RepID=UPI00315D85E3